MSDVVGNPEDRFSYGAALISSTLNILASTDSTNVRYFHHILLYVVDKRSRDFLKFSVPIFFYFCFKT